MRWIIKHNPSGQYICSKQLLVSRREFARKFNSVKQARLYVGRSDFDKKECTVMEYYMDKPGAPAPLSVDEISGRVSKKLYGLDE